MKPSALLLLLPALALAAPPASKPRAAALLVARDAQAEALLPRMEAHLTRALGAFESLQVRTPEDLAGLPVDPAAPAALKRAQAAYAQAQAAHREKRAQAAEALVRTSLQEAQGAVAVMRDCVPLCDATALHAALLLERGDTEGARRALLDLMALDPTYPLSTQHYRRELLALRAQVGTSHAAALRGSAVVTSEPAGARVYLDGEPVGYAPVNIPALAAGAHRVRLERPGFRVEGRLLHASADEQVLHVPLTPAPSYAAARPQVEAAARELTRDAPNPAAAALGKRLGLERALLGSVRTLPGAEAAELTLALYELQAGRRLAARKVKLQREELEQLGSELERLANHLLAAAASGGATPRAARSGDPLEHTHGTEDWSAEDRGGKSQQAEKRRKADDPLDAVSGTEDW